MSWGIPWMGSKNIYAKKILELLPKGRRLVDLFAGGCAITDCAANCFSDKWKYFLINDIDVRPIRLYAQCIKGKCPLRCKFVSREEFLQTNDFAKKLVWSFCQNMRSYAYNPERERTIRNVYRQFDANKTASEQHDKIIEIKKIKHQIQSLESLERLEHLESLERLERLESLERLEQSVINRMNFSNVSYEKYKYQPGDIVYCDIPYMKTDCSQYSAEFDHIKFYSWAMRQKFDVYISERMIPRGAEIVGKFRVPNRAQSGCNGYAIEYLIKV